MNGYANEDMMWQRLKDLQLEAENRRLTAGNSLPAIWEMVALLGRRAWWLAGLALRRSPRRSPLRLIEDEPRSADHAA
jgi:hypothetical protein